MASKYKLHYFEANARAAVARAILTYAKADWEDHRITHEEWGKIKETDLFEFHQMPILEHNGKKLSQSVAIDLYLLRQFNLYGKNNDDQYEIDNLLCTFDDLLPLLGKYTFRCKDEKEKEEAKKSCIEKCHFYIKKIEERYIKLGKGKYYLGDYFSGADIYLASVFPIFCNALNVMIVKDSGCMDLYNLIVRIKENELKEFHEKVFNKNSLM
jgi:glutathione S-transferase